MKKTMVMVCLAGIAMSLASHTKAETFRGSEVKRVPFTVSGGQTVELPMTDRGPVPAQINGIVVDTAGPVMGPSKTNPGKLDLIWAFSIRVPQDMKYDSAAIDEVSGPTATPVIPARSAASIAYRTPDGQTLKFVMLSSEPVAVTPESTSWVYKEGPSLFVYRIVLSERPGEAITLYQPTLFRDSEKEQIRRMAAKAGQ